MRFASRFADCDCLQVDRHSAPGGPGGPGGWKDDDQDSVYLESNCVDDVR